MANDVDNRNLFESDAQKIVRTLLENETVPPKPPAQCARCKHWFDHTGHINEPVGQDPNRISHGICQQCAKAYFPDEFSQNAG